RERCSRDVRRAPARALPRRRLPLENENVRPLVGRALSLRFFSAALFAYRRHSRSPRRPSVYASSAPPLMTTPKRTPRTTEPVLLGAGLCAATVFSPSLIDVVLGMNLALLIGVGLLQI